MKTRLVEHPKRFAAFICSGLAWLGMIYHWLEAAALGELPFVGRKVHGISTGTLLLVLFALAGFVCAMPDDREDTNERRMWLLVLWSVIPVVMLGVLLFGQH